MDSLSLPGQPSPIGAGKGQGARAVQKSEDVVGPMSPYPLPEPSRAGSGQLLSGALSHPATAGKGHLQWG